MNRRYMLAILDPIHEAGVLRTRAETDVVPLDGKASRESLVRAIAAADAVVVRGTKIDASLIAAAPNLKVVSRHGVDIDTVDVRALTAAGIALVNTPAGMNAVAVAEGTLALMLAVCKQTLFTHR